MPLISQDIQTKVGGYLERASKIKDKAIPALESRLDTIADELKVLHSYPLPQRQFDNLRAFADCIKISANIIHQFLKRLDLYIRAYNYELSESVDPPVLADDHLLFRMLARSKENADLGLYTGYMHQLLSGDANTIVASFAKAVDDFRDVRLPESQHAHRQEQDDQETLSRIQSSLEPADLFEFIAVKSSLEKLTEDLQTNLERIIHDIPRDKATAIDGLSAAGFFFTMRVMYAILDHFQGSALLEKSRNSLIDHRYQYNPDIAADLDVEIDYLFDEEAQVTESRLREEFVRLERSVENNKRGLIDYGVLDYNLEQLRATGFDFDQLPHMLGLDNHENPHSSDFYILLMEYLAGETQERIMRRP